MNQRLIVVLISLILISAQVKAGDTQINAAGDQPQISGQEMNQQDILAQEEVVLNEESITQMDQNNLPEGEQVQDQAENTQNQGEQNQEQVEQNQDQGESEQDQGEQNPEKVDQNVDQGEQNQESTEQNQDQGEQIQEVAIDNQDSGEQNHEETEQNQDQTEQTHEEHESNQDQGEQNHDQEESTESQEEQNHDQEDDDDCSKTESCLCHPSCICEKGSTICSKCKLESLGAVFDEHKKSCPCPAGYYTSSIKPFKCEQLFVPNTQGQVDDIGACDREVSMKSRYVSLNTNCYYCVVEGKSYVVSEVSLNYNSVSISSDCKSSFRHTVQFLNPTTQTYVDLDAKYFTAGENGSLKISIPLIDVYHLTQSTNVGESQISQQINLMSSIGTKDKYIKQIKWSICIYTNRDQVQIFQLDTDIQQTEQDCEDCIVIADLETVGEVYTDDSFETKASGAKQYFVGDYFYAKISFVDSSYTKFLKFVSLYYKNDMGQIYDYSSITAHSWKNNGLTIALPLSEPSHPAVIQVQMLIDSVNGGRFLQNVSDANSSEEKQKSNFSISVDSDQQQVGDDETKQSTSSQLLLLGLLNLMTVILLI